MWGGNGKIASFLFVCGGGVGGAGAGVAAAAAHCQEVIEGDVSAEVKVIQYLIVKYIPEPDKETNCPVRLARHDCYNQYRVTHVVMEKLLLTSNRDVLPSNRVHRQLQCQPTGRRDSSQACQQKTVHEVLSHPVEGACCYLRVRVGVAAHLLEEVPAQPRDDALVVGLPHHGVGLPRPRLAVRKDAHVVPCDKNYNRLSAKAGLQQGASCGHGKGSVESLFYVLPSAGTLM